MGKKKLTYIISNINKALAFEWLADAKQLHAEVDVHFILLNPEPGFLFSFLRGKGIPVTFIPYQGKKDLLGATAKIYSYLKRNKIEIVHTHLFDANMAGLLAAKLAGVSKRIHTRHHSTLHHVYFPRAVYYDRFINALSTHIVAISRKVEKVLISMEKVPGQKVMLIHHGFHLALFSEVEPARTELVISRHQIPVHAYPKIGIVARYTHWKGIQYIVPAFKKLLEQYPHAHLILANASGDYKEEIRKMLAQLPAGAYTEIKFEQDMPALYKLLNIYVHTPIDDHSEAFGQTYVEALAAGVPAVFTLSGVAEEFITNKKNALVVPFKDTGAIAQSFELLLSDEKLRQRIVSEGQASVSKSFQFERMLHKLLDLYKA